MPVRTAVITAAGVGTRFLPISKSVPKEMLPLVDRPVLQYAVEQAAEAGIERVVLVTSRGKTAMEDYFDVAPELERTLRERGNAKLEPVEHVGRMTRVIAVRQPEPLGLGHAVLMAKEAVGNEPFIVYLPDEILLGDPSVTRQMLDAYERRGNAIGVVEVPWDDVSRYGVVEGEPLSDRETRLTRSVEKPPRDEAPSNLAIVGPYVFSPAIFDCLEEITAGARRDNRYRRAPAHRRHRPPRATRARARLQVRGRALRRRHAARPHADRRGDSARFAPCPDRPDYADAMRAWVKGSGGTAVARLG